MHGKGKGKGGLSVDVSVQEQINDMFLKIIANVLITNSNHFFAHTKFYLRVACFFG